MSIAIPGLPESVTCTRIGMADADEFELMITSEGQTKITKGQRHGSLSQIIVIPAPGYRFVSIEGYDIRTLTAHNRGEYRVVKVLDQPREITATFRFAAETEEDTKAIEQALAELRQMPGYVAG